MQHTKLKTWVGIAGLFVAAQAAAQVTLYEREDFRGRSVSTDRPVQNLQRWGFNDRASSLVVESGRWQLCDDAGFNGKCVVVGPGQYRSLWDMGLNNEISSLRAVDDRVAQNDARDGRRDMDKDHHGDRRFYRQQGERVFEVPVQSVRAVVGPPETRCWVERQQVVGNSGGGANVPGAIAGAVIGGILGHQIGSGRGNDVATAGGAVAGAAIGANVDRGGYGQQVYDQDVQRCAAVPRDARPDYWDVTYTFRGAVHHMQTAAPPGPTITVNEDGEPRM